MRSRIALARRRPGPGLTHHSDQGSQHVSLAFGRAARQAGIAISMGSRGDAYDNAKVAGSNPPYSTEPAGNGAFLAAVTRYGNPLVGQDGVISRSQPGPTAVGVRVRARRPSLFPPHKWFRGPHLRTSRSRSTAALATTVSPAAPGPTASPAAGAPTPPRPRASPTRHPGHPRTVADGPASWQLPAAGYHARRALRCVRSGPWRSARGRPSSCRRPVTRRSRRRRWRRRARWPCSCRARR
jgi:hypothetical protein